jgi:hypothetical protein
MPTRSVRTYLRLLPAAALALALAACDAPADGADAAPAPAPPAAKAPRPPSSSSAGGFVVRYAPVRDTIYSQWQEDFREARFLEEVAEWLNGWIALPRPVTLAFSECGEPNAFYDEEDESVLLCFELVEELDQYFANDRDPDRSVEDALLFTALHEVGHAVIHVLDLPVTGREEDAADQLAALILADGSAEGQVAAINGVRGLPDDGEELDEPILADEHALSAQRYYNVLCILYGRDPDAYASWIEDGTLPLERAARCPAEYQRTARSWDALLGPYLVE